jgi:hypothetical protein
VNSPPCFLDLSLALARCCVLRGAITARIYVDDGYGSGRLSRMVGDADGSVNRIRGAIDELTAEEALLFWCTLCAIVGDSVAPHKIERGLDMTLLGLFVQVSRNRVRRGSKNLGKIHNASVALFRSASMSPGGGNTVSVSYSPVDTLVHANYYACELCAGTRAFMSDLS